jgi:hypothetical protein
MAGHIFSSGRGKAYSDKNGVNTAGSVSLLGADANSQAIGSQGDGIILVFRWPIPKMIYLKVFGWGHGKAAHPNTLDSYSEWGKSRRYDFPESDQVQVTTNYNR